MTEQERSYCNDLLNDNRRMFAVINAYNIVIKDHFKKLLTCVNKVVDSVGTLDYLPNVKELYNVVNDYIRQLYTRKCMYKDIEENLNEIKEIRNGSNRKTN